MVQYSSADWQLLLASQGLLIVSQGGSGPRLRVLDMQMHVGNLLETGATVHIHTKENINLLGFSLSIAFAK